MPDEPLSQTIQESVDKVHTAADFLHKVSTGPATGAESTVINPEDQTEQKTVAKAIADKEAEFTATNAIAVTEANKVAAQNAQTAAEAALAAINIANANGHVGFLTLADLNGDLSHAEDTLGEVVADDVDPAANNGVYIKVGASGSGSWTKSNSDQAARITNNELGIVTSERFQNDFKALGESLSFNQNPPETGNTRSLQSTRVVNTPATKSGYLKQFQIFIETAGTIKVKRISKSGNDYTFEEEFTLTVVVGLNTFTEANGLPHYFKLEAGDFIGIYSPDGAVSKDNSNGLLEWYSFNGDFSSTSTPNATVTGVTIEYGFTISSFQDFNANTVADNANAITSNETVISNAIDNTTFGKGTPTAETTMSTGLTRIADAPANVSGEIFEVNLFAGVAGKMVVKTFSRDGLNFTPLAEKEITVVVGANTIPVKLPIQSGQYVGLFFEEGAIDFESGSASGTGIFWVGGNVISETTFNETTLAELQLNYKVKYLPNVSQQIESDQVVVRSTTDMSIYLKTSPTEFKEFVYQRKTDLSVKNYDIWEIHETFICDINKTRTFADSITTPNSRWEHAFQVAGDADFSGGAIHGWEKVQDVIFLLNGLEWTPAIGAYDIHELKVLQKTNLNRWKPNPTDSEDLIAEIGTITDFSNGRIRLTTSVDWKANLASVSGYIGMFPARRDINGTQITDKAVKNNRFGVEDHSVSGQPLIITQGVDELNLFGGDLGLTFTVKHIKSAGTEAGTFVSNSTQYNKIYTFAMQNEPITTSSQTDTIYELSVR